MRGAQALSSVTQLENLMLKLKCPHFGPSDSESVRNCELEAAAELRKRQLSLASSSLDTALKAQACYAGKWPQTALGVLKPVFL